MHAAKLPIGLLVLSLLFPAGARASARPMEAQVVSIIVTSQKHDYASPWQKGDIGRSAITGCVVEGNRILTSAYSLADHVLVEVQRRGESRKFKATVAVNDYHCGLAIITVDDPSFFEGLSPVTFAQADGSFAGRTARVYKWDEMGSLKEYTAELTKSSMRFYEPGCGVLMHLFSTGMNEGGDGDPVFVDGSLVGVSTGLSGETKTLYAISSRVVMRMLRDLADGSYKGVPFFWIDGVEIQSDVNLREYMGMGPEDSGVLVTGVPAASSGGDVLKINDIIMAVGGTAIDDSGMYASSMGKLNYYGLLQLDRFVGETVTVRILRGRRRMDVTFPLKAVPDDYSVIPLTSFDTQPPYYIFGGLVFQELSLGYLETAGSDWKKKADKRLLFFYDNARSISSAGGRRRIVVLSRVLPDEVNRGYQLQRDQVLEAVNGVVVSDLGQLRAIIRGLNVPWAVFEFMGNNSIVIDRNAAAAGEKGLLKKYNIESPAYPPGK
jgi:hypothetical protein